MMLYTNIDHRRPSRLKVPVSSLIAFFLGMGASTIGVNFAGTYVVTGTFVLIALGIATFKYSGSNIVRHWRSVDSIALLFLAWTSSTEIYNSVSLNHAPNFGSIALWLLAYLASWPARLAVKDEEGLTRFALAFSIPTLVVSSIAVAQMFRLPAVNEILVQFVRTAGLEQRLAISREIRATSLIGHQIGLGAYLCSVMALLGGSFILANRHQGTRAKAAFMWIVSFVGQLATVTFATTAISLAISMAIAIKVKIRPWMIASSLIAALVGWGVFGSFLSERFDQQAAGSSLSVPTYGWLPETIGFRMGKWMDETIPASLRRPLTGWGYGVYEATDNGWPIAPYELQWMSPESEWFRTTVCAGIPALLIEVLLLVSIYRSTFKKKMLLEHLFPLRIFFIGLFVACFIHNHLTGPGVIVSLWAILGALWGSTRTR